MGEYKTPGVYIKEKSAFGNSVVEAETAIPAFIGSTEKAVNGNDDLTFMPWKISSMTEFITCFGNAPEFEFEVDIKVVDIEKKTEMAPADFYRYDVTKSVAGEKDKIYSFQLNFDKIDDKVKTPYYSLFRHMQLFFANGGGACYVVSVGSYGGKARLDDKGVETALNALKKVQEITMIVVPEAVESISCANIQQLVMNHCGEMKNRFAILDVPVAPKGTPLAKHMENFQNTVTNYFSYGAAYYPWLNTSVVSERDLDGKMFAWKENTFTFSSKFSSVDKNFINTLSKLSTSEIIVDKPIEEEEDKGKMVKGHTFKFEEVKEEEDIYADSDEAKKNKIGKIKVVEELKEAKSVQIEWYTSSEDEKQTLHQALLNGSPLYKEAIKSLLTKLNLLPPSAAMAGIYAMVDKSRGVWKAPANVTLNYVNNPAEDIDDDQQAGLNAPMSGKAINVIRTFRGEGVKVWGARTLDANSLDWRYINVRRTLLFLEESVKNAARAYVFEPNDAGTWINMKCMIENFLRGVWKRGGLAGATPEDAYEVHVGLGDTMTAEDILEGIMRVTVLVAISHPAEFIEITFQQQLQKS